MDVNTFKEIINGVGFPILACVVMWKQNSKMQETLFSISSTMQLLTSKITDIEQKMEVDKNDK